MATALVAGALANKPGNGGAAWTRLSWVAALDAAGFDVVFVEELAGEDRWETASAFFRETVAWAGIADRAVLVGDSRTEGLSLEELRDRAAGAALLLNISGHLRRPDVFDLVPRRVFLDLDPGYTQAWLADGLDAGHVERHDLHFTVGERIGSPGCRTPTGGLSWQPIRQPVDLAAWPVVPGPPDRLTTVASWRGPLGTIDVDGTPRGGKVHEFRRLAELPRRVPQRCEIALEIDRADETDRRLLADGGWAIADPSAVAATPAAFREYVQRSGAELSVAQGVYTATRCGWFSDRTVRYLASGKPAIVQDTWLAERYPVGDGLMTFSDLDEAVAAADRLAADYDRHAAAARAIAEEHFAAGRVAADLLEAVQVAP